LLLSSDSAEPFSRQAVRSTTGSILRLPVSLSDDLPGALAGLRERHGAPIIATSARAEHLAWEADLSRRPLVIVVGNETEGISDAVRHAASSFIRLPMAPNGASSLNVTVAAGVLLYEAVRQSRFVFAGGMNTPGAHTNQPPRKRSLSAPRAPGALSSADSASQGWA
jgi:TrmH family RNA methyltransferase